MTEDLFIASKIDFSIGESFTLFERVRLKDSFNRKGRLVAIRARSLVFGLLELSEIKSGLIEN